MVSYSQNIAEIRLMYSLENKAVRNGRQSLATKSSIVNVSFFYKSASWRPIQTTIRPLSYWF